MARKLLSRYDIKRELDGTWTVYDIFTGVAYALGASVAIGMQEEFAVTLKNILNQEYWQRISVD